MRSRRQGGSDDVDLLLELHHAGLMLGPEGVDLLLGLGVHILQQLPQLRHLGLTLPEERGQGDKDDRKKTIGDTFDDDDDGDGAPVDVQLGLGAGLGLGETLRQGDDLGEGGEDDDGDGNDDGDGEDDGDGDDGDYDDGDGDDDDGDSDE